MPCWYFERKEIENSPSSSVGIDTLTENRYRREGARFIIDAGTRMGLRYDTCATGVVYFHRFYMFHSFKEFHRYVTAACCLLLAGKVEETPKKCKDIIRIAQSLLSPGSFARFGDDPREEVMAMERVLLKTIKFDFQVDHPYGCMLKYAKMFKGDKEKTQKMAQMAWTFINDSLCTTLCLQWEPEIIAVSLMYLASRLTKFEPTEWSGRSSSKSKWWEDIIEGLSMDLMEVICHKVLDLYSKPKKLMEADSPPQSPAKGRQQTQASPPPPPPPPDKPPAKRTRESTPSESEKPTKSSKLEDEGSHISTIQSKPSGGSMQVPQHIQTTSSAVSYPSSLDPDMDDNSYSRGNSRAPTDYAAYNPYISSQNFSSSFMSLEGSQNIQSILAGSSAPPPAAPAPPSGPAHIAPTVSSSMGGAPPPVTHTDSHHHHHHHQPPPPDISSQYPPPHHSSDSQYGYPTPPAPGGHVEQPSYSYPPPPSQYGAPPHTSVPSASLPPSSLTQPHYQPPPTIPAAPSAVPNAPPPGFDPYMAPPLMPNVAAPYHSGPPPSYPPPPVSSQPPQHHYPSSSIPPPQAYPGGGSYYPSTSGPPPPLQSMSQPSSFPQAGYSHQHGGSQHGYGSGGSGKGGASQPRHHGSSNFHRQKHHQRKDIPALTDIKISGRSDWGQ